MSAAASHAGQRRSLVGNTLWNLAGTFLPLLVGLAAVPLLLSRLRDSNPDVIRRAMGALVTIGDPRAVPPLIELTTRRPPQFVAEVLYALGSLGGSDAEAYLYTMERGAAEDEVRRAASEALGAGAWRTFRRVTLPLALPGIVAGCLLTYAASITALTPP